MKINSTTLWLQGFIASAANPKAAVIFAALYTPVINPELFYDTQVRLRYQA